VFTHVVILVTLPRGNSTGFSLYNVTSCVRLVEWKAEEIYDPTTLISVDTEAPVCGFCPPDQTIVNATGTQEFVNWDHPECTDNSGIPPYIYSERQPGSYFSVPSATEVFYIVRDDNKNENLDCSFRITIESEYLARRVKN